MTPEPSPTQAILDSGIIAVIRSNSGQQLLEVARAIAKGGIRVIEFTMTIPGALEIIRMASYECGDSVLLGAGTVLDPETARAALLAGAEFIVCPTVNRKVIRLCQRYGKAVIPGAYTPTEILRAWEEGAPLVKLFPADSLGPSYVRAVLAPLPQVRLVPTGGISLANIAEFFHAGASAVAVGGNLADKAAIEQGRWDQLAENAKQYREAVDKARGFA